MGWKSQVSESTVTADTAKKLIGTITVPDGVSNIVGVCVHALGDATLTTAEPITGIFELESDDAPITPAQFILDCVSALTQGAVAIQPRVWATHIPVRAGNRIKGSITLDRALAADTKARYQLIYN